VPIVNSLEEIKDLKDNIGSLFGKLQEEFKIDDQYMRLDFAELLNLPRKFKKSAIILPTSREVVDTCVDHIAPTFRRVTVPRRTTDTRGTEQAQTLQRFYESLLNYIERPSIVSPYRDNGKHVATYGITIGELKYNVNKWPVEPKSSQYEVEAEYTAAREEWKTNKNEVMPFTYQCVHPNEIIFDPFNDPPLWVIRTSNRYVYHLKQAYPNWANASQATNTAQLETWEYWDARQRAVVINQTESALRNTSGTGILNHKWGVHPYIIEGSGLGMDDIEHNLEQKYVGLLRFIRQILCSESRSFSIADIVLRSGAWPIRVAEGDRANEMPSFKLEYGEVQPLPPGVKITNLMPELPPDMLFNFFQVTSAIIAAAAAPRVVRGMNTSPGLTSGFDRQLTLGESRLRYGSIADAIERLLTGICYKAGVITENVVKGSINIAVGTTQDEFMSISARDFRGHHAVSVQVNVLEPEDEVRKHQDVATMVTAGLMSPQKGIAKVSPDVDPDTEYGRILASKILYSPEVMSVLAQGVMQKLASNLGMEDILNQILQAAQQPQGVSAQGRRPASPENAGEPAQGAGSRTEQGQARKLDMRATGMLQ
jgi:hypothetical protein